MDLAFQQRAGCRLGAGELHALLALRVDVFLVEQRVVDPEVDGRDLLATTTHLWFEEPLPAPPDAAMLTGGSDHGAPVAGRPARILAAARLLAADDHWKLGRVVVAPAHRRAGLGSRLVRAGCHQAGRPLWLHAQAHLQGWYASLGFVPEGAPFEWAGVPHVAMRFDG